MEIFFNKFMKLFFNFKQKVWTESSEKFKKRQKNGPMINILIKLGPKKQIKNPVLYNLYKFLKNLIKLESVCVCFGNISCEFSIPEGVVDISAVELRPTILCPSQYELSTTFWELLLQNCIQNIYIFDNLLGEYRQYSQLARVLIYHILYMHK